MTTNVLDLATFTASREHALFAGMRASPTPVFTPETDGPGFWSLTQYAHVAAAARDHKRFVSGQGTQIKDRRAEGRGHPSVHNSDGPLHGRLRGIALSVLTRAKVIERKPRFSRIIERIVAEIIPGVAFDFVDDVAIKIPMLVIANMLGVPENEAPYLVDWANQLSDVRASNAQQAEARTALFDYFRGLADLKRAAPADDVASALVAADLADEALDAYFMLLTVAGNETTRFLLTGGLAQLARQPEDYARVRADRALIAPLIEEMCRFVSPVGHMRRTAAAETDLFGAKVDAGAKVVLWFASANHDESVFPDADRLIIDRSPNPHVGFGLGAHFCLGAHLARLETALFLNAFLDRFSRITLVEEPVRLASNWFTGWTSMKLVCE